MKKRRQSFRNSVKIPQVREDFQQMTKKDLQQWIDSHELRVKDSHRTKKDVVAQAKEIWDAINDNTLDKLKKRDHAKRTQRGRSERISVF
jgi:trans-2-enoyl-CoA reductase